MTPDMFIRYIDVDLGYGGSVILKNISCSFNTGDSIGLVGPNGSGKTTFLRSILSLMPPHRGVIECERSRRFAYVPQVEELNFFWPLTVREAVCLPARSKHLFGGMTAHEEEAVENAMSRVGISDIANQLIRDISGGQRQKAILAQAMSQEPDVLLLDEPTKGLDVVAERDLLALIQKLKTGNLTIFLVAHSLQIPLNYTEKLLLFKNGSVIQTTPEEIMHTKRLEDIYGIPFLHQEQNGMRWVMPLEH